MKLTKENIVSSLNKAQENMLEKWLEENKNEEMDFFVERQAEEIFEAANYNEMEEVVNDEIPTNPYPITAIKENQFLILCNLVEKWAAEKGILEKATPETQAQKTLEEVNELIDAIDNNDELETKDAIGDILVTLIIQCKMQNMDILDCLNSAYNVIKNRTGRMENGTFVKDK